MITKVLAPKTGLTAESIAILQWHKKQGDPIQKEEVLLTIESEKATLDVPAPRSGFLVKILADAGQEDIPVSEVIGLIGDSADETCDSAAKG
ncbi:MAG: biotin/lipoyl-containing protein [Desulfobacterales bacterium]